MANVVSNLSMGIIKRYLNLNANHTVHFKLYLYYECVNTCEKLLSAELMQNVKYSIP